MAKCQLAVTAMFRTLGRSFLGAREIFHIEDNRVKMPFTWRPQMDRELDWADCPEPEFPATNARCPVWIERWLESGHSRYRHTEMEALNIVDAHYLQGH